MKMHDKNGNDKSKLIADKLVEGFVELKDRLRNGEIEKLTCRKVVLDLHPVPYSPETVIATRRMLKISQSVFAQFIGVKTSTIRAWEQGRNPPPDIACRFMDEIQRNPEYWRKRIATSIRVKC